MFSSSRGLDSFDQYLREVEKYSLIQDRREERELAYRARAARKCPELCRTTAEE